MDIKKSEKSFFSDTPIPDIFIKEYMPVLDALAVKIYIYLLFLFKSTKKFSKAEIAGKFDTDKESVQVSLTELASYNLITFTDNGVELADIKSGEMEKVYKPKEVKMPSANVSGGNIPEKEKMISDINKTFFAGLMSSTWYYEIENWMEKYGFKPQVVYALFNECKRRGKANNKAYVGKVAQSWAGHGIVTYDDLNDYFLSYDKVVKLSRKIGQKLRKNMTAYDEEIVTKWVDKMNYDFDIIEIALRKTSRLAHPNLEYTDKLLEEWFSNSLKSTDKIREYEEKKRKRYLSGKKKNKSGNVANFEQREYTEEYFDKMTEDVSKYTDSD